jgi:hypothetical protein
MSYTELSIPESGRLSLSLRVDGTRPWWRDLDLDGEPLYRIGNICETCEAMMSQFKDAKFPISPSELSKIFLEGLTDTSDTVIETISQILPKGNYGISLLEIKPALAKFYPWQGKETVYLWINSSAPMIPENLFPNSIRPNPLWAVQNQALALPNINPDRLYEVAFPLIRDDKLNRNTIESYKVQIRNGLRPTALSFSVVDIRYPSGRGFEWQLAHFLLDGHHKMMAASELDQPITLLSFLNLDESFAPAEFIKHTINLRYKT